MPNLVWGIVSKAWLTMVDNIVSEDTWWSNHGINVLLFIQQNPYMRVQWIGAKIYLFKKKQKKKITLHFSKLNNYYIIKRQIVGILQHSSRQLCQHYHPYVCHFVSQSRASLGRLTAQTEPNLSSQAGAHKHWTFPRGPTPSQWQHEEGLCGTPSLDTGISLEL